jgi:proteasome lid subunit RPN8/RPN11
VTNFRTLSIGDDVFEAMLAQALAERPHECCGLLAGVIEGDVGRVTHRYPLINELHSPVEYQAEVRGLIAAHRHAREHDLEILATYHSHPTTTPVPSKKDLAASYGDCVVCLIVSLMGETPLVRGWWLGETDYREAEWQVIGEGRPGSGRDEPPRVTPAVEA